MAAFRICAGHTVYLFSGWIFISLVHDFVVVDYNNIAAPSW